MEEVTLALDTKLLAMHALVHPDPPRVTWQAPGAYPRRQKCHLTGDIYAEM